MDDFSALSCKSAVLKDEKISKSTIQFSGALTSIMICNFYFIFVYVCNTSLSSATNIVH